MPRVVDKEQKKAEILKVAMQVFARNGVIKTKMIDIAEAAGIGKGTIYEYFSSKEEIFTEAYNQTFSAMESSLLEAVESIDDPVEKLDRMVELSLQHIIAENADFIGVMMDFWAEGIRNKDHQILDILALHDIYSKYRRLIAGILTDGIEQGVFRNVDIHSLSAIMIAALDGFLLQWIMDRDLFDMKQVARTYLDTFLNGIKKV
jgi:AcrR family transcriptional regulator